MNKTNIVVPLMSNEMIRKTNPKDQMYQKLSNDRKINDFITSMYGYKDYMSGICIFTKDGESYKVGSTTDNNNNLFDIVKSIDPVDLSRKAVTLLPIKAEANSTVNLTYLVPVVKTITDNYENVLGYTVVFFDYKIIEEIFGVGLPQNSKLQIVDDKGDTVYTNSDGIQISKPDSKVYNLLTKKEAYNEFYAKDTGWSFKMLISAQGLMGDIYKAMMKSAVFYLIIYAISLVFLILITYRITQNIKVLSNAMEEISENGLDVQVNITSQDEIGKMSKIFNQMVIEMKQLLVRVEEKEKQKREAEIDFLQAQINPHFLSNALNTVTWMANIQNAKNIVNLSTSLTSLLHASMRRGRELITVTEELEHIKSYIEIEQCCYIDNFEVIYKIDPETKNLYMLRFLMQPIVENALIHSLVEIIDYFGELYITASIVDDNLKLIIWDNGKGMSQEQIDTVLQKDVKNNKKAFSSIGIKNVNDRIKLSFGENYGLSYESQLGEYTKVCITLPVITTI